MGCSPSRTQLSNTEIIPTKTPEYLLRSTEVKHSLGVQVEVKGFCDAVISLCGPQEEIDYEVSIGGHNNTLCRMRGSLDPDLQTQCDAMAILDPAGYRGFWLSWRSSQITLGRGYRPGHQEMLSLPAAQLPVTSDYRPYCLKVSCPAAGGRVAFRNPRLLVNDDF